MEAGGPGGGDGLVFNENSSLGILLTHHLFLSFSLGGWKLLFDIRNKALRKAEEGVRGATGCRKVEAIPQTSWGEGQTWEAAARPAL